MVGTTSLLADPIDQEKLRFVDVEGSRTRYYDDGDGEPLVIFPSNQYGTYNCLDYWSLNFRGLAKDFRVYAVDPLGSGYTDNPKQDSDYSFEALAQHLRVAGPCRHGGGVRRPAR